MSSPFRRSSSNLGIDRAEELTPLLTKSSQPDIRVWRAIRSSALLETEIPRLSTYIRMVAVHAWIRRYLRRYNSGSDENTTLSGLCCCVGENLCCHISRRPKDNPPMIWPPGSNVRDISWRGSITVSISLSAIVVSCFSNRNIGRRIVKPRSPSSGARVKC